MDEHEYQRSDVFAAKTVVCAGFIRIDPLYYLAGSMANVTYSVVIGLYLEGLFWRDLMNI